MIQFAEESMKEADTIYRNQHNRISEKLDDLHSRGIEFQTNFEGPFILAAFSIELQSKMGWSDQELFKNFKRNLSKL